MSLVDVQKTARRNNADRAEYKVWDLEHPFAEGAFRHVAQGRYTKGKRKGEKCVCKWFKTGCVYEDSYFDKDIAASNKAVELIQAWNRSQNIDKMVQVNLPEVWTFDNDTSMMANTKILQEPFIENYEKFNSNTGWKDDSFPWARVMQALSHFSYHVSGGRYLLCDLQGGVYSNGVVLTDPVVMSTVGGIFGPTDLGRAGISSFFCRHVCNEYCCSDWQKPRDRTQYYTARQGTTMDHVATRSSRPAMTHKKW